MLNLDLARFEIHFGLRDTFDCFESSLDFGDARGLESSRLVKVPFS